MKLQYCAAKAAINDNYEKRRFLMEQCKITNLYDLNETIAAELLTGVEYPWEA